LSIKELKATLANPKATQIKRSQAALELSWHKRCAAGQQIDFPVIDFGAAKYVSCLLKALSPISWLHSSCGLIRLC